jgi:hypothetical protein
MDRGSILSRFNAAEPGVRHISMTFEDGCPPTAHPKQARRGRPLGHPRETSTSKGRRRQAKRGEHWRSGPLDKKSGAPLLIQALGTCGQARLRLVRVAPQGLAARVLRRVLWVIGG